MRSQRLLLHLFLLCTPKRFAKALLLLLPLLLTHPSTSTAQDDGRSQKEQEKILAKEEKQKLKDARQAEKELRKHHMELQDKATARRIRRHNRRADRRGSMIHRDPWIVRLFTRR